jgi:hypothetical protein
VAARSGRRGRGAVAARGGRSGDPGSARHAHHRGREAVLRAAHGSGAGGGSPDWGGGDLGGAVTRDWGGMRVAATGEGARFVGLYGP